MTLVDTSQPLHVLREKFPGLDIHYFTREFQKQTGQSARIIPPSHLRVLADDSSPTGNRLYCVAPSSHESTITHDGELLEPVHQVGLELMHEEYATLSFEALCEIARRCNNDPRSIFLINDERMLGILFDELNDLVAVQKVLTPDEADLLRHGIAPSLLPSSESWAQVERACQADDSEKDNWVLKAARDAFGHGHVFGTEVSAEAWRECMAKARACNSSPRGNGAAFILQRRIPQVSYDIMRHGVEAEDVESFYVVASYCAVNGRFARLGGIRIARLTHLSVAENGAGIAMVAYTDLNDGEGSATANGVANGHAIVNGTTS